MRVRILGRVRCCHPYVNSVNGLNLTLSMCIQAGVDMLTVVKGLAPVHVLRYEIGNGLDLGQGSQDFCTSAPLFCAEHRHQMLTFEEWRAVLSMKLAYGIH